MTDSIAPKDYEAFCRFLENACGIVLGENKHYLVSSRLNKLLAEASIGSVGNLLEMLNLSTKADLRARVIDAMTTNETFWFRDNYPFNILNKLILPEMIEKKKRQIKIWSAACSSGQEPYSISMAVQEYVQNKFRAAIPDVQITGSDISPSMLKYAKAGVYDNLALSRGLSQERRKKFFMEKNNQWQIKDEIKNRTKFVELNLMKPFSNLGKFDVIFCRNVLIYFSTALKKDILARLAQCLEPEGYLFLGGSESIANYSDLFETVRHENGIVYRLNKLPSKY